MRSLRFIHRWLGILLALPLLVQGLSGALLTLEPVLPEWGGAPLASGPAAPANALLAAAAAVAPPGTRAARFVPADAPGSPAQVSFAPAGRPRGPGMVVSLDPATATPLGPAVPAAGVLEWVRRLHTNFLVPDWGGRQVVGWVGVGLLLLTLLGLPLWWSSPAQRAEGRWREAFTVPRGARGTRLHRRLHGAMGIWMFVMMLATSTTGIVQGFPQTSRALLGVAGGGPPRGGRDGAAAPMPLPDLDAAIALAAAPGLVLRMAMLPAGRGEPLRLVMAPPGTEGVSAVTTVLVDMAGPRVLSVQAPGQAAPGETALRWAHDLHFGQGFGPVWRGLTVLVGLALPAFGVTGVSLWLLKRRNRQRQRGARQAALSASPQAGE